MLGLHAYSVRTVPPFGLGSSSIKVRDPANPQARPHTCSDGCVWRARCGARSGILKDLRLSEHGLTSSATACSAV